jgi:hypothetical protein
VCLVFNGEVGHSLFVCLLEEEERAGSTGQTGIKPAAQPCRSANRPQFVGPAETQGLSVCTLTPDIEDHSPSPLEDDARGSCFDSIYTVTKNNPSVFYMPLRVTFFC